MNRVFEASFEENDVFKEERVCQTHRLRRKPKLKKVQRSVRAQRKRSGCPGAQRISTNLSWPIEENGQRADDLPGGRPLIRSADFKPIEIGASG